MPWSDLSIAALRVSLATFIVYFILSSATFVIDYAWSVKTMQMSIDAMIAEQMSREPYQQLYAAIWNLLTFICAILACLEVFSYAATKGLMSAGYAGLTWSAIGGLFILYDLTALFETALPQELLHQLYAAAEIGGPWYSGAVIFILLMLAAGLLVLRPFRGNSLMRAVTVVGLPLAVLTLPWVTTSNTLTLTICMICGAAFIWKTAQRSGASDIFILTLSFLLFNLLPDVLVEIKIYLEILPPVTEVRPVHYSTGFTYLLLPLLAAAIVSPKGFPDLRKTLLTIFAFAVLSWVLLIWPDLRNGSYMLHHAQYIPNAALPGQYPPLEFGQSPARSLIMLTLWLINTGLILWCYLQVWKAR